MAGLAWLGASQGEVKGRRAVQGSESNCVGIETVLASSRVRRFTDEAILDLLLLEEKDEEERPAMGSRSPGWNSINPHLRWKLAWIQREGLRASFYPYSFCMS